MTELLMAALTLTSCFRLTYPSFAAIIHEIASLHAANTVLSYLTDEL